MTRYIFQYLLGIAAGFVVAFAAPQISHAQTLVAPSSATASNQLSPGFDISQTINGGGLTGSTLAATHDLVTDSGYDNKFWISTPAATLPIVFTYTFATAPTLAGVGIWNAVFELPMQGHYEFDGSPSVFDLEVTYSAGTKTYTGVSLSTTQVSGQRFDFCENLTGVSEIRFTIQSDTRPSTGTDRNIYLAEFRGLEEALPTCANPLPGAPLAATPVAVPVGNVSMLLSLSALLGVFGLLRVRRRYWT
ncbi:hypothetical protein [Ottowia sp.]|uniref:hypothetical protein n=1 Tax=Ottowia sp. TaxID=1898956 RepID=UPI003A88B06C